MILEKVINRIVIQSEYKDFVDKYIDNLTLAKTLS
jgi:hypothetical protein